MKIKVVMNVKDADGEVTKIEVGDHYLVTHCVNFNEEGAVVWDNFSVYSDEKYMPDIKYHDGHWYRKKEFVIQTAAYGSMDIDGIEKVVAGYNEAVEVVKYLNKEYC